MKQTILNAGRWTAMVVALFGLLSITGCTENPFNPDNDLVEDGLYIQGPATNYTEFDLKAALTITKNEVTQENRSDLVEIYVAIKGGSGGFNIVEVAGETETTYGPAANFGDVVGGTNDEPNVTFQRGGYAESTTSFTVPSDGLYHIIMDKEVKTIAILPVEYWGAIGAATPGGWSTDTQLSSQGFDFNRMTFEASAVEMTSGEFKFRYSGGWKVEIDSAYDLGNGLIGIKANTNLGGAVNALVPGGANIMNAESGYYTITMTWVEGEGMSATTTRTGDLPPTDWSSVELGLVGDGLTENGAPHNWDTTIRITAPSVVASIYTYTFNNVTVNTAGGGFKFREGQTWDDAVVGFSDFYAIAGDGASEFTTNEDNNLIPSVDGATYKFKLVVDAGVDRKSLTITKE